MVRVEEIIMASTSRFRRSLFESTGLIFRSEASQFDEGTIESDSPVLVAQLRALGKAQDVAARNEGALVLGADQVLEFEGKHFGKVESSAEAIQRLMMLSGKTHKLLSAFVLVHSPGGKKLVHHQEVVEVPMRMRDFSEAEAKAYVNGTDEWRGVVGCYQYENRGLNLFEEVGGDHSSVIGLPLLRLLEALRKLGINPLLQASGPWQIRSS